MAKNIQSRNQARNNVARTSQAKTQATGTGFGLLDPNELKNIVRDGLVSMTLTEREDFIQALETEMRRINLNVRSYLIPLGIPGRSPDDLTPTEIGHLIRFLKINVPQAMGAIDRAMVRFTIFSQKMGTAGDRLAA